MVRRARTPSAAAAAPWVNPDVAHDYAEGRTMGQDWNCWDGLVAELAVLADRERRIRDSDIKTSLRVASSMGLFEFNNLYIREKLSRWGYGLDADND